MRGYTKITAIPCIFVRENMRSKVISPELVRVRKDPWFESITDGTQSKTRFCRDSLMRARVPDEPRSDERRRS